LTRDRACWQKWALGELRASRFALGPRALRLEDFLKHAVFQGISFIALLFQAVPAAWPAEVPPVEVGAAFIVKATGASGIGGASGTALGARNFVFRACLRDAATHEPEKSGVYIAVGDGHRIVMPPPSTDGNGCIAWHESHFVRSDLGKSGLAFARTFDLFRGNRPSRLVLAIFSSNLDSAQFIVLDSRHYPFNSENLRPVDLALDGDI
jgi:hypothetical protein